ncbi:MAG: radical SAM protein [Kiritimatiellia bacterium]
MQPYRYIFGPVPSRRFGRSLGVDLTPLKTCTLDCIFCQLGHTSNKTIERREYVPVREVQQELIRWEKEGSEADFITLSGSGEPTLHSGFGEILKFIKDKMPAPAVVLTNGTLLWLPEVRKAAAEADIAKLSLSVWDAASFQRINQPHEAITFERYVTGLQSFRAEYSGKIWLEVFLIDGMNSAREQVEKIARIAGTLGADEIHLNTAVRPPADSTVHPVPEDQMADLAELFRPAASIIAGFPKRCAANIKANEETILNMLRRRPCTARQIADAFGMHVNEVSKYAGDLLRSQKIRFQYRDGEIYFAAVPEK